jgi:lipopolysaccharide exporter
VTERSPANGTGSSGDGEPGAASSLGTRTLRGMFWAYGSYVGGRVLVLFSTAILARILAPDDFGLVALALIFIALLETVADLGVGQALIIAPDDEVKTRAETAWLFSVALGAGLALLTAILGPAAATFFREDGLIAMLPVLGINFFVRSLGSTHYAIAQKRLDFRSRTAAEIADVVVRGSVGVALAVLGLGAWSLVLAYVAGTATLTAVLWTMVPWRPSFRPRRGDLRLLLRFGGTLSAVDVIAAILANVDYVLIGRVLGTTALGLYTLAFRLPELLILNLSVVAGRVLFPAFAAVGEDQRAEAFITSFRYTLMVSLPIAVGLAALAAPLTTLAFGDQWSGSVTPMKVLTLYALGVTVGIPAGATYKAVGRADILLKLAIPRACLLILLLAIFVDRGIAAVASCQAVVAGLFAVIGIAVASRMLRTGAASLARAAWPALVASGAMGVVTLALSAVIDPPLLRLAGCVVAGGAAYAGILWLVAREHVMRLIRMARPKVGPPEGFVKVRETDVVA